MSAASDQRAYRLSAIDTLRGLAIVIMAIDHVRDFVMAGTTQDPLAGQDVSVPLFFTRWITHICAPVFVALAGVSAGLMLTRRPPREVSRLLATRGLWLIVIEWTMVSLGSTFSPLGIPELGGAYVVIMQVIWAIGASMVVLSGLVFLGRPACLFVGLAVVTLHNLVDPFWPASHLLDEQWPIWVALHSQMAHRVGPVFLVFVYPLVPWIGVMAVGFGAAGIFEQDPDRRNALLFRAGLAMTLAFVAIRAFGVYGDPNPWRAASSATATVLDFINTTKYPPSLLFLLMTLGPAAMLCSHADRWHGPVKDALVTFGRVPFAFYVAHIYLIHLVSIALGTLQGFDPRDFFTLFLFYPQGYGVGLAGVYAIWALVLLMLYPVCRGMATLKARRRDWWLSYV